MTLARRAPRRRRRPSRPSPRRATGILGWVTTTDHKRIGIAYMVTAFVFFLIGGAMAELIRAQLAQPDQDLISEDRYNQLFTMHGTIMLLLFVSPFAFGLANYLVPLQIGAKDMAFPRLNALGYWLTLFAGIVMLGGFATARRRGQVRVVRLRAAVRRRPLARPRRRPLDRGHRPARRRRHHHRASTSSPPCPRCGPRA